MLYKETYVKFSIFISLFLFVFLVYFPKSRQHLKYFGLKSNNFKLTNDYQTLREKAYLVNTPKCQIIDWPLFDEQVLPLFKNKSGLKIKCKYKSKYDITVKRYNFTGIQIKNKSILKCFSSCISRSTTNDNKIYFSKPVELNNSVEYFPEEIAVKISCQTNKGDEEFERVIPLIPEKTPLRTVNKDLPNILFVGLDSISRINFDRHFPITAKLLKNYKFYTMYGYNKVADNTFVNLTPLLTGHYVEEIWNETITEFFNYFPFIWKEYEKEGYQTLLMEDAPNMATFNYLRKGFSEPPTTYYLRPFSIEFDKNTQTQEDCYFDEPEVEVYYDYLYDFLRAMDSRNQNYFAFHFMARLTHNDLNKAGFADSIIAKLFTKFFNQNLLTNTILIFFSDHGIRFGPIRETLIGKVEERLPFMHLYIPEKWRNKYSNNLAINQNRLTTPFDIHETLMHIVRGKPNYDLRYGKTLFEEIPENRSCNSVSIADHWCACHASKQINNLTSVEPISHFIVKSLNTLLAQKYSDKCVHLKLNKTITAFEQQLSDKVIHFEKTLDDVMGKEIAFNNKTDNEFIKHYLLTINVKPSNALFEATVKLDITSGQMLIIGEVSRINKYGNQSSCISDSFMRRYCFCGSLL